MKRVLKSWFQENQPYLPVYILAMGILGLGIESGICALVGHEELIEPIATGAGVLTFACYFIYLWWEYRSFGQD